jgi:hypothetical protein
MLALDFTKRRGDGVVEARVLESLQQKPLQNVDAPSGRVRVKFRRDEIAKRRESAQCDTATDDGMRGNTAEQEREPRTQPDRDQHGRPGETSLVGPDQRTAQRPLGGLIGLEPDRDRSAAVGYDAEHGASFRRDNPEASDRCAQRLGRLMELNLRPLDEILIFCLVGVRCELTRPTIQRRAHSWAPHATAIAELDVLAPLVATPPVPAPASSAATGAESTGRAPIAAVAA